MNSDRREYRPVAAIGFACAGVCAFSMQSAILKWLTGSFPIMELLFVRSTVTCLVALVLLHNQGGLKLLRSKRPWGHGLRCLLHLATILCLLYALTRLPLADTFAIIMAAPLFTTSLSVLLLGERPGARRWSACLVGFVGVLVMLRPSGSAFNLAGLAAVASALFYSLTMIQTRRLAATEHGAAMVFYSAVTFMLVGGAFSPFVWQKPGPFDLGLMMSAGALIGVAHYWATQGYRFAPTAVVAPFDYTTLVWGVVIGFWFWQEIPDFFILFGGALVVGSGLFILRTENRNTATEGE